MTSLTNIQQVLSNISSVEKVQQVHQHHAQMEQSRLVSQNQKVAEERSKKIEDADPSDKVDISIREDQQSPKRDHGERERGDKDEDNSGDTRRHIDIRV